MSKHRLAAGVIAALALVVCCYSWPLLCVDAVPNRLFTEQVHFLTRQSRYVLRHDDGEIYATIPCKKGSAQVMMMEGGALRGVCENTDGVAEFYDFKDLRWSGPIFAK